jgi:hypothetical protein
MVSQEKVDGISQREDRSQKKMGYGTDFTSKGERGKASNGGKCFFGVKSVFLAFSTGSVHRSLGFRYT